ncbi:MAG: hypothetical protein ACPG1A_17000, partial [Halioglobus sp.]
GPRAARGERALDMEGGSSFTGYKCAGFLWEPSTSLSTAWLGGAAVVGNRGAYSTHVQPL